MSGETWLAIAVIGPATYLIRASFLVNAHRFAHLPPHVETILRQIPPAVLAALVAPAVVQPGGRLSVPSPELVAAIAAALVAWRWKSSLAALAVGMVMVVSVGSL